MLLIASARNLKSKRSHRNRLMGCLIPNNPCCLKSLGHYCNYDNYEWSARALSWPWPLLLELTERVVRFQEWLEHGCSLSRSITLCKSSHWIPLYFILLHHLTFLCKLETLIWSAAWIEEQWMPSSLFKLDPAIFGMDFLIQTDWCWIYNQRFIHEIR